MKKAALCLLAAILALSLLACGKTASDPTQTTAPADTFPYPTINQKLTWNAIEAFPVKHAGMTEEEMRQLCVDFFQFSKTALWTPNADWEYVKTKDGETDQVFRGKVYGGLPYIGVASGNVYRLMDYINESTGVVDMTEPMQNPKLFGNQCSIASYWGWARVINSADFGWTYEMVHSRGFLRVGPYTYDDKLTRFQADIYGTDDVIRENGAEIMYASYAAMKKADGLINYTGAGHAMMCSGDPVVVYDADGKIDPAQSYLLITDQHGKWVEATNEAGDTYTHKNYVNRKYTFFDLMNDAYIPFTFAEFSGADPIEDTQCDFSHTGDTITLSQLNAGTVSANYGISDIYAIVLDAQGSEVLRVVKRADQAGLKELNFNKLITAEDWAPYTDGSYTVQIVCQLGTGERPTVYTGTLAK